MAIASMLAACAVGPDFSAPAAPVNSPEQAYNGASLPAHTQAASGPAGASQHFDFGADIPTQWWALFQSEALDRLIRAALAQSPSYAAAQAALRQAQENYNSAAGSTRYPAVSAQLGAQREHASSVQTGTPGGRLFDLYNASVNVSYTLDLFGASRRQLEGLASRVDYQRYQVEAARLALAGNVVTSAIREASLRGQLQATAEVLSAQSQQLAVVEKQFAAGAIARSTLLTQRGQLAQTRASVPALEKALAQSRHQLAVYVGQLPGQAGLPPFELDSLSLPVDLPVSLPSSLVRQRPDIRASEALLHQASAQLGVATANLYPQINLTASLGSTSTRLQDLFGHGTGVWGLAAGLTQPLFNGGALNAQRRAALAAYEGAEAQYRQTVLLAFQDVADVLRALQFDADTLAAQAEAQALARQSLDLGTRQYQLGAISYLALLDAQRTYQQARIALVQARAARYADTAALFQALGGGWWNAPAQAPHP